MDNNNNLEVILFSKYSPTDSRRKELVNWLTTTVQSAIGKQHELTKKLFLSLLKDTPAIYMS
jgi:hypothetical protein